MNNKKGFTLIELLVVMSVIAILAGIVLVSLRGFREKARDSKRIAELKQIQNVLEIYYTSEGTYPATLDVLEAASAQTGVAKLPKDPVTKANYLYGVDNPTAPQSYVLGATLEKDNTVLADDIDDQKFNVNCGSATADTVYCISF